MLARSNSAGSKIQRISRAAFRKEFSITQFSELEESELNQVQVGLGDNPIIGAPNAPLDFLYIALFQNQITCLLLQLVFVP